TIITKNTKVKLHSLLIEDPNMKFNPLKQALLQNNTSFTIEQEIDEEILEKVIKYFYSKSLEHFPLSKVFSLIDLLQILDNKSLIQDLFALIKGQLTQENLVWALQNSLIYFYSNDENQNIKECKELIFHIF